MINSRALFLLSIVLALLISSHIFVHAQDDDEEEEEHRRDPLGDLRPKPPKKLKTMEDIKNFVQKHEFEPSILGFFNNDTNPEDLKIYYNLAKNESKEFRFGIVTKKEILTELKYQGCAVVVCPPPRFVHPEMEKPKYRYPDKTLNKTSTLMEFIVEKSLPLVAELTDQSRPRYYRQSKPLIGIYLEVDYQRNGKHVHYVMNRARKLAKQHRGNFIFFLADMEYFRYSFEEEFKFQRQDDRKTYVGIRDGDMYYEMTDEFSVESVTKFIDDYKQSRLQGKLKIHYKPPPTLDDIEEEAIELDETTIEEVLEQRESDVMIKFYAPWSTPSKEMKAEYNQLVQHYEHDDGVLIASFDGGAGSVPLLFDVHDYPTVYFVPAHNKTKRTRYTDKFVLDRMIRYVETRRNTKAPMLLPGVESKPATGNSQKVEL